MLLEKKLFFVKEKVEFVKLSGTYDIFDPETNQQIGVALEEPGGLIKLLRLFVNKLMLPTKVNVFENTPEGGQNLVFSIHKPLTFIRPKVSVFNGSGEYMGYFKSKLFSLGGGFWVYDAQDQQVAEVKGDWKGWNFRFLGANGQELGSITKKWAGIGKELFTSADNYMIAINDSGEHKQVISLLLLAAGISIDIIFKENK